MLHFGAEFVPNEYNFSVQIRGTVCRKLGSNVVANRAKSYL